MSAPPAPYHGHFRRAASKSLVISVSIAALSAVGWKYGVIEPRKQKYADFYKTYDPIKDAERMKKLGIFERNGKAPRD